MMAASLQHSRDITGNEFGHRTTINQGDIHYHLPHRPASARSTARVIPYPRNTDLVRRPDLVDKLDELLLLNEDHRCAALWGLGGSGKTQIALEYAYGRFTPNTCGVFWVHADSGATVTHDYKTIAAKLGVDKRLEGEDLFEAVRDAIESQPSWVLILDNADDLTLFGVGESTDETKSLQEYLPQGDNGTVLWTSRDGRVADIVGPRRAIEVASMTTAEAMKLLAAARNDTTMEEVESEDKKRLLEELQWLPLAISQARAYMRRTSTPIKEYLSLLRQGRRRWDVLAASQFDPHRRRGLSHSVLKTWNISVDRIRQENWLAHRILHVIAFVDNQNITFEMMAAASGCEEDRVVEVKEAVARLMEFSFLSLRQAEEGEVSYDMHKLVQEATRHGLGAPKNRPAGDDNSGEGKEPGPESEAHFASVALGIMMELFPQSSQETWGKSEKYLAHAIRVCEWAQVNGKKTETADLLSWVSYFLYQRGRWREKEPVDVETRALRRDVLGERHPDTIRSMANLAATYHEQGRYDEAEKIKVEVLALRRDVLGEMHPDTIRSMANLAATYREQGRYDEAEKIDVEVLALRCDVLGEMHPDTIRSMADLAATYHKQGQYDKAEKIDVEVLALQRDILGKMHPDTIRSMASLAATYYAQGGYDKAEKISVEVLALRRDVLGEMHPDTIRSMANLAATYHEQGRYNEAEKIDVEVLALQRDVLGEMHPDTIRSMAELAVTYYAQGLYSKAEKINVEVLALRRHIIGKSHPDTLHTMHGLAMTWYALGRLDQALYLMQQCFVLQHRVLGAAHPTTVRTANRLEEWELGQRSSEKDNGNE